ncbi:MAG TPA: hypothetical protein VKX49_02565 [Bryobacteraceae bacterium]|nr:hypothetical protein [Bryobacteraceae bacterium]
MNISVVFGMVVMPLTYYPIMDKGVMKRHANAAVVTAVAIVFLALIRVRRVPIVCHSRPGSFARKVGRSGRRWLNRTGAS